MQQESRSNLDDVLLGITLAVALVVGLRFLDAAYDDAYITYRYARNIAAGSGFVYNPGVLHLGTTTPLYTLLLAALGLVIEIPTASGLLSIASLCAAIAAAEGLGRAHGIRFVGPLTAFLLVPEPQIYRIFGGETLFVNLGLLPVALLLHVRGARLPAALLFGLAILGRMDAALFVGLVYGWETLRTRKLPLREICWVIVVLLPWAVWAQWTFGSPLPATLVAKMAQGQAGGWKLFFEGALPYLASLNPYHDPLQWIFLPLLVLGLWQCIARERIWLVFVLATTIHALAYQFVLQSSFSHWYLASAYLTHALVLGAGLRWLLDPILPRSVRSMPLAYAIRSIVLACLASIVLVAGERMASLRIESPRRLIYTELGEWLRDNTAVDASVAYFEIGYLGYHSERTIIDPVGLVTPGGAEHIERGELFWFFDVYEPDYYVHNPILGRAYTDSPWFRTHYQPLRRFEAKGFRPGLILYRRL